MMKFCKWQALLRSDLPDYMVPFDTKDLTFKKPEVCMIITIQKAYTITSSAVYELRKKRKKESERDK